MLFLPALCSKVGGRKMVDPQLGDVVLVNMAWALPDGHRLRVTFESQVEAVELDGNRLRIRVLKIQAAGGSQPESEVEPYFLERVMALIGKHAQVPLDTLQGIVLPLRLATLTGEHPYFSD
jgi:hypothetical protein